MGDAAQEVRRPVDGIDDPKPVSGESAFGRRTTLLAQERIAGKGTTELVDDEVLHRAVGGADHVLHTLEFNGQIGPVVVVSPRQLSGLAGDRLGRQKTGGDVQVVHVGRVPSRPVVGATGPPRSPKESARGDDYAAPQRSAKISY